MLGALAVLSLVKADFLGGTKLSFFRDILTHVRFLVAPPVLIALLVFVFSDRCVIEEEYRCSNFCL
jgi:hypothetical protein